MEKVAQPLVTRLNEVVSAAQLAEPPLLGVTVSWKPALEDTRLTQVPKIHKESPRASLNTSVQA